MNKIFLILLLQSYIFLKNNFIKTESVQKTRIAGIICLSKLPSRKATESITHPTMASVFIELL